MSDVCHVLTYRGLPNGFMLFVVIAAIILQQSFNKIWFSEDAGVSSWKKGYYVALVLVS